MSFYHYNMNKNLISFLSKFKSFPLVSVITFTLATLFLISIAPLHVMGAGSTSSTRDKSPLDVYTLNYSEGKWDGWMDTVVKSMSEYITGPKEDTTIGSTSYNQINLPYVAEGGAVFEIARVTDTLYEMQPASFIVWAQDQYYQVREGVSFTTLAADPQDSSVYAPGIGYNVLQPVLGLWQWSRNIVYGFYIIILIAIAFLILLRQPMGGQEIVTIANSIPSVIISMVLVTFSYALCGLFIDAIYLGSNVVYNFLFTSEGSPGYELVNHNDGEGPQVPKWSEFGENTSDTADLKNVLQPDDPQMSIWNIFSMTTVNVCNTWNSPTRCSFEYLVPKAAQNNLIGQGIAIVLNLADNAKLGIGNALIELILALAVFQTAFKLFFTLLNNYLILSFYPIIAPFIFLGAALPSNTNKTLNDFFKTLGGASLTFIVLYAMFLLLVIFGYSAAGSDTQLSSAFSQAGQIKWTPPLLGYTQEQIFDATTINNNGKNIVTSLLVFGLYMATPTVLEMVKKFLEVNSPFQDISRTGKDITEVGKKAMGTVSTITSLLSGKAGIFSSK